jgi:uncharacterized protein (DUF924 family)
MTADDILTFWFVEHGKEDWFGSSPEFDALIADRYTETFESAARGETWRWRTTPEGRLAEIVVLDQFPRQLFRGQARAFSTDPLALVLAQEMVGGGHHNFLPMAQRMFALLPYQHSESAAVQAESLRLHTAMGEPELIKHAEGHAACIRRFGRFPKRNAALGRVSTPDELDYIESSEGFY